MCCTLDHNCFEIFTRRSTSIQGQLESIKVCLSDCRRFCQLLQDPVESLQPFPEITNGLAVTLEALDRSVKGFARLERKRSECYQS